MLKKATLNDIYLVMEIIEDAKEYLRSQNSLQWNQEDGYPTKDDMLDDILNSFCYLYIENNRPIGVMSIVFAPDENYEEIDGKWLTTDKYASIHRIAVKNTHHHKHIGVKMLLEAENIVIKNNIFSIKIDTHKINIPMSTTLKRSGYTYCGLITLKRSNEDNLRDAYEKRLA